MTPKNLITLAALGLSGSIALAQQTTPPPPPPAAPAQQAAPVERQPPSGPGMRRPGPGSPGGRTQGGPQERGKDFHAGMMAHGGGRGDFHGGPGGGFRGPQHGEMAGGMGAGGFHIAPGGMWWKNPSIVQKLTLTADQTKKMDDIFQKSRLELIDLKASLDKHNVTLEPMLSANPPDTAKAMAEIDKVAQARADLEKANAKMLLSIRGVLTPDQWTKLNTRTAPAPAAAGTPAQPGGPGGGGRGRGPRGPGAQPGIKMDDTRP
jgi:Spy/CpxP family protein refolding chaperone